MEISNWGARTITVNVLETLLKLGLYRTRVGWDSASLLIRRHKSRYDKSSIQSPSFWD